MVCGNPGQVYTHIHLRITFTVWIVYTMVLLATLYIHVCLEYTCIMCIYFSQPSQGSKRGRGSFTGNRSKQPQLHAKGARGKARTGSTSDYSKADFMKTPQGGG